MLYAILCYHDEAEVQSCSQAEDEAVCRKRALVTDALAAKGKLSTSARLMPTTAAATLRPGREPLILDGPFAETKEQLLGLYVVDCASFEEALDTARRIKGDEKSGAFEIRPLRPAPGSIMA